MSVHWVQSGLEPKTPRSVSLGIAAVVWMREGLLHLRRHGEIEIDALRRDGRSEPFGIKRCHRRAGIEFGGCPVDNGLERRIVPPQHDAIGLWNGKFLRLDRIGWRRLWTRHQAREQNVVHNIGLGTI